MNLVIPAILAKDEQTFFERLRVIERIASLIQIDAADGRFVPNESWCNLDVLQALATPTTFELHLMVEDPEGWIKRAVEVPPVKRVIWHVESMGDHRELLRLCRSSGREAGLAVSPKTPASSLAPYIGRMDVILVLGVEPGLAGQKLIPETVAKARQIFSRWPDIPLAFDGGVNSDSIPLLRDAGVAIFCAGSAIFGAEDPEEAYRELRNA